MKKRSRNLKKRSQIATWLFFIIILFPIAAHSAAIFAGDFNALGSDFHTIYVGGQSSTSSNHGPIAPGTYWFTVDGMPYSSYTEWYVTSSDGSPVDIDDLILYNDPQVGIQFTTAGTYTIRAEIWVGDWAQAHRFNVTVVVPKEDTRISSVDVSPDPLIQYKAGSLGAKLTKDDIWNTDIPNKFLNFYVNGSYVGSDSGDSNGISWESYTPPSSGSITVRAVFVGDSAYNPSEKSGAFTVTAESVTTPGSPSASPSAGETGQSITFTTSGSTVNSGHIPEYRYNWGDGSYSSWSTSTSHSHSYTNPSTYNVSVQARCSIHTSTISASSSSRSITIVSPPVGNIWAYLKNKSPGEEIVDADGSTTPRFCLYTQEGVDCKSGHNFEIFNDVAVGGYWLEGYYTGTFLGEELWTSQYVTVSDNTTNEVDLIRDYPYAKEIHFWDAGSSFTPPKTVPVGADIKANVIIKNEYRCS